MKRVFYFNILTLFLIISFNCQKEELKCKSKFAAIKVRDTKLGISYSDLEKEISPMRLKETENRIKNFNTYTFSDYIIYDKNKIKINYFFTFSDNSLISYHFDIIGDRKLFENMVDLLYRKKSELIKSNSKKQMSYFVNNNGCKCFFNLIYRGDAKLYISGGIENDKFPKLY